MRRHRFLLLGAVVFAGCSGGPVSLGPANATAAGSVAPLGVRAIEANTSSVKVDFDAVPGAADYRIYDAADPSRMKYAGLVLPASHRPPLVPNRQIEWNGLVPGKPVNLIVEAVDRLGPFPATAVAGVNPPLPSGCAASASSLRAPASANPAELAALTPGSDLGLVPGALVINGRGCPASLPNVIARSAPFAVAATGRAPLPSGPAASQVFIDDFAPSEAATLARIVPPDPVAGSETFTLGHPPVSWTILVNNADVANTSLALVDGEFSDVLFDGATPGVGAPHSARASVALVPNATADFSGGRILHTTLEIDSHFSNRRWFGISLAPVNDPIDFTRDDGSPNRSGNALFFQAFGSAGGALTLDEFARAKAAGPERILGAPGQAAHSLARLNTDLGLDNRERWDLFVSQTHVAIVENGVRLADYDLPAALPFAQGRVYFTHYFDHSATELSGLRASEPWEDFWIQDVPFSDQRHWANAGFEVLPAATPWSSLNSLLKMPAQSAPGLNL